MSFLTLTDVGKRYGDFVAVEGLTLSIEKGEFASLLGPSGCGKTTTLQMIAGFVQASSGRIVLDGRDITHEKPNKRGLGIVFQSYALFPHMTIAANVAFGLEMRGVPARQRTEKVMRALELVRLERFAQRYPRELSGGQRQRVALARALVIEPPVLLLDEPMSNLDAKLREDMQEELREIQRTVGTTTLMVTHDQAEALSMSDRVVVMNAGRVVQDAAPRTAYDAPCNAFVANFVGRANLFEAHVIAFLPAGKVSLESAGLAFEAALPLDSSLVLEAGHRVTCCLRPEKIQCLASARHDAVTQTANRVDGTIRSAMFLGDQWMHRVETPVGELTAMWSNTEGSTHALGDAVTLGWTPQAIHIVGVATEANHD